METGLWAQLVLRALWFYVPGLSTSFSFLAFTGCSKCCPLSPRGPISTLFLVSNLPLLHSECTFSQELPSFPPCAVWSAPIPVSVCVYTIALSYFHRSEEGAPSGSSCPRCSPLLLPWGSRSGQYLLFAFPLSPTPSSVGHSAPSIPSLE